jgi:cytochrome P450
VKSLLSFFAAYLAGHPAQYRRLTTNPALIPAAMEELLRVHGIVTLERGATHDFEFCGVPFRTGDRVALLTQIFGLDDRAVDNPYEVNFDRRISPHLIFGAGPHRCIGSHLARIEIRVFLEEWCKTIPAFSLKPGAEVKTAGGVVWAPTQVPVVWPG